MTAKGIVEDYLKLCRNPAADVMRWIAEDKKFRGSRQTVPPLTKGGQHAAHTQSTANLVAEANRLCGRSLPELRDGLDADGGGGQRVDGLSARSRAGLGGDDGLRLLRSEGVRLGLGFGGQAAQAATRRAAVVDASASFGAEQGRAFVALAHVVADAGGGGWPEQMTRDLQACRTPQERNAWAEKWGKVLSGQADRERRGAPERPCNAARPPSDYGARR